MLFISTNFSIANKQYLENKKRALSNSLLSYYGAPKRSRTPNLLIRSQTLYPIELWALFKLVPRAGIEPARVSPPAGF